MLILMDLSFQKNPVEFKECTTINKDEGLDAVKQEFPKKLLAGKFICFFCNEDFESIDLLHSHQNNCTSVCDIQAVLANARSSYNMKRHFLSQLNLISTVKAKHLLSEKKQNVVVDVIVIDDNSDDENTGIVENQNIHYLQNPSNFHSKSQKICSDKSSSSGQTSAGKFSRLTWKVFKFDLTSPLGMRLRYRDCCPGSSRLSYCRIINDYEQYCGYESLKTLDALSWNRHFPVTFRKNRHLKYTHRYKFTRRHSGLNTKSQKLRQQMKTCSIELGKFDLLRTEQSKKFTDVAGYSSLLSPSALMCEKTVDDVVLSCDSTCERKSKVLEHPTVSALLNLTAKQISRPHAAVECEASSVMTTATLASMDTCCLNDSCDPPVCSVASSVVYPPVDCSRVTSHLLQETPNNGRRLSFGDVEFLPLGALCGQAAGDSSGWSNELFQISSLFSMADNVARECVNAEERTCTVENVDFFGNSLPPTAQLPALVNCPLQADPKTAQTKPCDLSVESACQNYQMPGMTIRRSAAATDTSAVIDLTEPPLQNVSETDSRTSLRGKRAPATALRVGCNNARRDYILTTEASAEQCNMPDSEVNMHVAATPLVIEIPDEDYSVTSASCQSVVMQPSIGKNLTTSFERVLAMSRNSADHLPAISFPNTLRQLSDSQPLSSLHHSTSDQRPIESKEGNAAFQNYDVVDLSADSDCELTAGDDSLGKSQKRLNSEDSHLPPLTFKCHVCHCLFEFGNNSSILIQKHYSTHGIMNIKVVRQRSSNGRSTWSIVELDDSLAPNFPSYPMSNKQRKDSFRNPDASPSLASLADSSNGASVNCDVSSVNRTVEQWQQLSAAHRPSSGSPIDRPCAGYQGVAGNNRSSDLGERTRASLHSHLSTGPGMMSRNACHSGRELATSQVLDDEVRSRRLKPVSVKNSLTAFHIFPRPDFLEQHLTSADRENCVANQLTVINSSNCSNAKGLARANTCSDVHVAGREKLVEAKQKDCYSYVANSKCTQTAICLD